MALRKMVAGMARLPRPSVRMEIRPSVRCSGYPDLNDWRWNESS